MITKERLLELIGQGATIYEVKYGKINPVSLKNKIRFVSEKYPVIVFEPRPDERYKHHKYFDKLFETLEQAEWHKEFGCIERTERLELPTWEEINQSSLYTVYFNNPELYLYRVYFNRDAKTITIEEQNEEYLECFTEIEEFEFTKENYTKACRKCKELFLGGKDE